ncbi:hypothetical protein TOPH_00365 [Tolypocladium ophioglossoides CBS 100239]|uniref:Uncharacterized protein n=1 Tax=Tolypocladium ophioglossoides (strain CBS 100239) TaxID=1163406 RepID=A0A0L0NNC4_TOLOC|nr:hypothetical protein TOPH_00365 [Tolypocladium ophioglossoides CBS 100239]
MAWTTTPSSLFDSQEEQVRGDRISAKSRFDPRPQLSHRPEQQARSSSVEVGQRAPQPGYRELRPPPPGRRRPTKTLQARRRGKLGRPLRLGTELRHPPSLLPSCTPPQPTTTTITATTTAILHLTSSSPETATANLERQAPETCPPPPPFPPPPPPPSRNAAPFLRVARCWRSINHQKAAMLTNWFSQPAGGARSPTEDGRGADNDDDTQVMEPDQGNG